MHTAASWPLLCASHWVICLLQGIYNLPNCGPNEDDPSDKPTAMCLTIQHLVATGAYLPFIRCPAQFEALACTGVSGETGSA